jgi:hypothetical protein
MSGPVNPLNFRADTVEFLPKDGWLSAVVADYRRAMKAAQRYESLRRQLPGTLARAGIEPSDIPRLVFDECFRD